MTAAVVDSSGWVEFLEGGVHQKAFGKVMRRADPLVVSTICIYEVFRAMIRLAGHEAAEDAIVIMRENSLLQPVDEVLALAAARLSVDAGLAMADAMVLETARMHGGDLWTLDADFKGLPGVHYIAPA